MKNILRKFILNGYGLTYPIWVLGDKIIISKGLYKSKFSLVGLNLKKAEREIFGGKFLQPMDIITLRFGKIIITYGKKGYSDVCKNMTIIKV